MALVVGGLSWLSVRAGGRLHAPDLSLLGEVPPAVVVHLGGALTALSIGVVLLLGVKGNRVHRTLGWTWVIAMAVTAVSSLFIRQINGGAFSFIHLLSGWTIIVLPMAVFAARRHQVARHSREMTGLFVGGLLLAGALSFLPGRLLWEMFLG
ncbi:DUF2306 domain-containing protein [Brevundimonas sp. 2R-24]|uniref:DUF2306 domain-containing protein n=1 Tax=Peiella sedimenti TaxID=3061083 RepID=A0ABT8SH89_9CAUL|nr:DUF2306 domain-containing protein [Caulobacteraceae bacterium XZ-24]